MKKTTTILLAALSLCLQQANGQDRSAHDNLANVYSEPLGTTATNDVIKVDPYTGTANASFLLYKYNNASTGLDHEITLGYNASGNRVDDIATECGLNWSINTGGKIVRTILGRPDDLSRGFSHQSAVPTSIGTYDTSLMYGYITDSLDGQFDIFNFNAGGASGRFILGKNGKIVQIPESNTRIEILAKPAPYRNCNSDAFKITTPDGTQYFFSDFNCTLIEYRNGNDDASTEWYLSKMVSNYSIDTITFHYDPGNLSYNKGLYGMFYRRDPPFRDPDDNGQYGQDNFCNVQAPIRYSQLTKNLSSISYPDGTTVNFHYDPFYRIDLPFGGFALRSVSYTNAGSAERGYKFNYSYMVRDTAAGTASDIPYMDYTNVPHFGVNDVVPENYSLQLNDFHPYSGSDSLAGYVFKYNSLKLPPRLHPISVDLWGYYNGEVRIGPYNIPGSPLNQYFPATRYPIVTRNGAMTHQGGTGLPNLTYAKAKSLENIILPTGGRIGLTYELHTSQSFATPSTNPYQAYAEISGLRVKEIVYSDGIGQNNDRKKHYEYLDDDGVTSSGIMVNTPVNNFFYTESLNANDATNKFHLVRECQPRQGIGPYYVTDLLVRSASPLNSLIYTHGSPVGYRRVTEYDGTQTSYRRKTVYEFTTNLDYQVPQDLEYENLPFPLIPDLDYACGLLKKQSVYTSRDELLTSTDYTWDVTIHRYDSADYRALKAALRKFPVIDVTNGFVWRYTYPLSGKAALGRKETASYYNSRDQIRELTTYAVHPKYEVVQLTGVANALGEWIETRYYYPFDFSTTAGAIGNLKANQTVSMPVRIETWNTARDQLLSAKMFEYGIFNGAAKLAATYDCTPNQPISRATWGIFDPNVVFPNQQFFYKVSSNDLFNSKGNLLQATEKTRLSSIVWGYHNTQPVATVQNAGPADISYTSFESGTDDWFHWSSNNGQGQVISNAAATGQKSYQMASNEDLHATGLNPSKRYVFTAWTDNPGLGMTIATPNGNQNITPTLVGQHRGWYLLRAEFSGATGIYFGFGFASHKVDEVRLHPFDARMETITYQPFSGVTSECDASNRTTYTEYDGFGRMKYRRDMDGNIIQAMDYSYQEVQN